MQVKSLVFRPNRCTRRLIVGGMHLVLFAASALSVFLLRFEFSLPQQQFVNLLYALPVWLVLKAVVFELLRIDRSAWRFICSRDLLMLLLANFIGAAASAPVIALLAPPGFPRSIYILDLTLCALMTCGARLAVRILFESRFEKTQPNFPRAFIYGAGAAGVLLLRESCANSGLGFKVCGFIDDDPSKAGMLVHGVPVLGAGDAVAPLARKSGVQEVVIAAPSATRQEMLKILTNCANAKLRFRTMPSLSEVVHGQGRTTVRDVAVEDLLGRVPVRLEEFDVRAKLEGQTVLVTGAAGSIGSELCRQIARFQPRRIVGFDASETGLFYMDREMQRSFPAVHFEPYVSSIQNPTALARVFEQNRPSAVYHAAAYKHVPLMENHIFEAIENNVLGTYNVARAAELTGVRDFVMISSDKAVRPTSIMGLTKRIAEILLTSMQKERTKYLSVRFGNVLGSNGSAVPLFRQQIAAGGPITITHPEMRRYFMTIPEAAQLVLQAFTMGRGGEIFVLDMGQPVKVVDLAKNLILLSGLRPGEDVKIEFTGIRPGEKLYEELSAFEEQTCATYHEKVRIFSASNPCIPNVSEWIANVHRLCTTHDFRVVVAFKELVSDYNPSSHVMRSMLAPTASFAARS